MRETIGNLTVEDMIKALKESISFEDVFKRLGVSSGTNNRKKLKFVISKYGVSIDHFNRTWYAQSSVIYFDVTRKCLWCEKDFTTKSSGKDSHKCCSTTCANRYYCYPNANRAQKDTINLEKERLKANYKPRAAPTAAVAKDCEVCGKTFLKKKIQPTCGRKCGSEMARRKMVERVKNGLHKGWATRPNLSYAEKFFIEVLKSNLIFDECLVNHPVSKYSLGLKSVACYFLDFYFPDLKLDLEIDGSQHEREDRKASDVVRTAALEANGYIVYRIKWKNPKFDSEYIKEEIRKFLEFFNELKLNKNSAVA